MISSKIDVSVIIASYNRLWALPKAVESCRNNDCLTEIIVVDDGSSDDTWSWLQNQKDVVSIRTDNWGKAWAINAGQAASSGEFIRFLDSDDWLLPRANDRQLALARTTQADVVIAGHVYLDEVTGSSEEVRCPAFHDFLSQYIDMVSLGVDCHYSACLMRRSLIANIPHRQEFPWDDIMFMMEVGLTEPVIAICDFASIAYRQHHHDHRLTISAGVDKVHEVSQTITMYKRVLTLLKQRDELTSSRAAALFRALWHQARRLAESDIVEAKAIAAWIRSQDEHFAPPVNAIVSRLYQLIGFSMTERVARVRRSCFRAVK